MQHTKSLFRLAGVSANPWTCIATLGPWALTADSADRTVSADSAVSESSCSDWTPVPLNPRLNDKGGVLKTWHDGAANGLATVWRTKQPSVSRGPGASSGAGLCQNFKAELSGQLGTSGLSLDDPRLLTVSRPARFLEQWMMRFTMNACMYIQPARVQFMSLASGGRERKAQKRMSVLHSFPRTWQTGDLRNQIKPPGLGLLGVPD